MGLSGYNSTHWPPRRGMLSTTWARRSSKPSSNTWNRPTGPAPTITTSVEIVFTYSRRLSEQAPQACVRDGAAAGGYARQALTRKIENRRKRPGKTGDLFCGRLAVQAIAIGARQCEHQAIFKPATTAFALAGGMLLNFRDAAGQVLQWLYQLRHVLRDPPPCSIGQQRQIDQHLDVLWQRIERAAQSRRGGGNRLQMLHDGDRHAVYGGAV